MRKYRQWIVPMVALVGVAILPANAAQAAAAAASGCATTALTSKPRLTAEVTICRDTSGNVTSVYGNVADHRKGDHQCARLDVVQVWGDIEAQEYTNTVDLACAGQTTFTHDSGWRDADIQLSLTPVAGGSQG
jgi:hypothetical protein